MGAQALADRARAVGTLVAGAVVGALGLLFAAAGKAVGLLLAPLGLVAFIAGIRMLRPRAVLRRRGDPAPIEAPSREALESLAWPLAACPRCGFMDLLWGGPARLVARCVRCGYQGEPGVYASPRAFEDHLDALKRV